VAVRIELVDGDSRAVIARRGAELVHWSVGGRPLTWAQDPSVWPAVSPILFPVVGWAREGHSIVFETPEEPTVPVIAPGGLLSDERRPVPLDGGRLALNDAVLAQEALCFLGVRSRSLRYAAPDGSGLRIDWEDFAHCAIWSRPPAPFVSIESWSGHGDPVGFSGELADKPSMRRLEPGEVGRHAVRYGFEAAGGQV
jgi:galactose mutarotase-like enzyme